jgi:CheY-like chemotaxis protein
MRGHAVPPTPTPQPGLRDRRVLVVEDEALVAMLLEDELRMAGAEVLVAFTPGEALRLMARTTIDGGLSAAVLDIDLGGEKVTPVTDALAGLGVPFLFATGYADDLAIHRHPAAPVLRKPCDPQDIIAALATLLAAGAGLAGPRRPRVPDRLPLGSGSLGGEEADGGVAP